MLLSAKVFSERPELHSEVVSTGGASGAGVPPPYLNAAGRSGAPWPRTGPARACLGQPFEAGLSLDPLASRAASSCLPAGLGLPSSLWPSTLGLRATSFSPPGLFSLRP